MRTIKADFMLLLCQKVQIPNEQWGSGWELAQDAAIAQLSALADKLVTACQDAKVPAAPPELVALTLRDWQVLECLQELVPPGGHGALGSQWMELVRVRGYGSRRAYESSRDRLLAGGHVRRAINRYMPVRE